MKYYAQFLNKKLDGTIGDALGSDGIYILDGRQSLINMVNVAETRMIMLNKNLSKGYVGFKIMRGERFSQSTEIYRTPLHTI